MNELKQIRNKENKLFLYREWISEEQTDRPLLLFLGGNGFPVMSYAFLLNNLSKSFNIIAFENRAIHQAFKLGQVLTWHDYAQDLLDFIDLKGLEFDYAMGHSMGASTILLAASKRKNLFPQLILMEPIFVPVFFARLLRLLPNTLKNRLKPVKASLQKTNDWSDYGKVKDDFSKNPQYKRIKGAAREVFIQGMIKKRAKGRYERGFSLSWEIHNYKFVISIWAVLKKVNLPCLGIYGKDHFFFTGETADRWKDKMPQLELMQFPENGHLLPFEAGDLVAETIIQKFSIKKS